MKPCCFCKETVPKEHDCKLKKRQTLTPNQYTCYNQRIEEKTLNQKSTVSLNTNDKSLKYPYSTLRNSTKTSEVLENKSPKDSISKNLSSFNDPNDYSKTRNNYNGQYRKSNFPENEPRDIDMYSHSIPKYQNPREQPRDDPVQENYSRHSNISNQGTLSSSTSQLDRDLRYLQSVFQFLFTIKEFRNHISYHSCDEQCLICYLKENQSLDKNSSPNENLSTIMNLMSQYYQSGEVELLDYQNTLILFLNILHLHYLNFGEKSDCKSLCLAHKLFGYTMKFSVTCSCRASKASTNDQKNCVFHLTIDERVERQTNRWLECMHPRKLKVCSRNCSSKLSYVTYDPQCNGNYFLVELDYKLKFSHEIFQRIILFKARDDYSLHSFITNKGNVLEIDKRLKVMRDVVSLREYPDIWQYFSNNNEEPIILAYLKN